MGRELFVLISMVPPFAARPFSGFATFSPPMPRSVAPAMGRWYDSVSGPTCRR
jgi:hypothetical protein